MVSSLLAASALALSIAPSAFSQFVAAPTDLINKTGFADIPIRYKQVPTGICELNPKVKSYSGYADVAENEHIFWWFFESRQHNPEKAPLTVWINGGPGSSSMIGLFQENGPCRINSSGGVENNPYAWNEVSNMIFIDQPAQTGFSYTVPVPGYVDDDGNVIAITNGSCPAAYNATCGTYSIPDVTLTANSTAGAAPNLWKTLQGFMGAFPEYSRYGFNFATESYGGHYGPVFNEYIETQNAAIANGTLTTAHHINLESVAIGNGWFDPLIQYAAYYNFSVFPGNTYDVDPYNQSIKDQVYNAMYGPGQCYDQTVQCYTNGSNSVCSNADDFCYENVEYILDLVADRDEYDIRELQPDPFPPEFFVDYLNTASVQAAIGAFQNFTESSDGVGEAFGSTGDDDRLDDTVADLLKLVEQGLTVTLYVGDADYICNWLGVEAVAAEVHAPDFDKAGFTDLETSDGVAHGQVKQAGKFSFVRIYESGHEVPFYQPLASLAVFERGINGKDIATGRRTPRPGFVTKGPQKSTYREGNATVQYEIVPTDATYNTTTNEPNPYNGTADPVKKRSLRDSKAKRSVPLIKPGMKGKIPKY